MAAKDPFQKAVGQPDDPDDKFTFKYDDETFSSTYDALQYVSLSNSTGVTGWSYCQNCGSNQCSCISSGRPAPTFVSSTVPWDPTGDEAADLLEKLKVCIVCGAEDSIVLCEICVEAVKLARNEWLRAFREEIESLG